jgi:hypothetical protein
VEAIIRRMRRVAGGAGPDLLVGTGKTPTVPKHRPLPLRGNGREHGYAMDRRKRSKARSRSIVLRLIVKCDLVSTTSR